MNFAFGKNEEPLDLTKGGDAGSAVRRPTTPVTPPPSIAMPREAEPQKVAAPEATEVPRPTALPQLPRKAPQLPPPTIAKPPTRTVAAPPVYSPAPSTLPTRREVAPEPEQYHEEPSYPSQATQPSPRPSSEYREQKYQSAPQQDYAPQEQDYGQGYRQEAPAPQSQYGNNNRNNRPETPRESFNPAQQPNRSTNMGSLSNNQAPVEQVVQMVDRKGRPITPKAPKSRKGKPVKEEKKKTSSFTGNRQKVLWARVAVFGILGILIIAGLSSFIPKSSGLTSSDGPLIVQKVKESLGISDFPATAGEGIALGFSKVYLNYNPDDRDTRYNLLLGYAPEGVIGTIDPSIANEAQIAAANTQGAETATPGAVATMKNGAQTVTDGPYLVRTVMVQGGETAIFTTKTQVNGKTWIYMEIPMRYDATTGSVTVAASPTFVKPIETGTIAAGTYDAKWNDDDTVVDAINDDMTNYMRAWGAGDTATLERFTVKDGSKNLSTPAALSGLDGSVRFVSIDDLSVELKPALESGATASDKADFYVRDGRVTVSWLEPESGLVYSQTYQLELKYVNSDWFVQDIQNLSIGTNEYKDKL